MSAIDENRKSRIAIKWKTLISAIVFAALMYPFIAKKPESNDGYNYSRKQFADTYAISGGMMGNACTSIALLDGADQSNDHFLLRCPGFSEKDALRVVSSPESPIARQLRANHFKSFSIKYGKDEFSPSLKL